MTEAWPGIPYISQQGSPKVTPFRTPTVTDLDDGNFRARRSATKNIATVTFSVEMTNADFLTFKAWVRDTLVDGTLPFTMPIWDGSAYTSKMCMFTAPYQDDPGSGAASGVQHAVALSLDVDDY